MFLAGFGGEVGLFVVVDAGDITGSGVGDGAVWVVDVGIKERFFL